MIRPFLFILFFALSLNAASQKRFEVVTAASWELSLKNQTCPVVGNIPFKNVIVKDFRFDTTKFGYLEQSGFNKVVLGSNSSSALTGMLNDYYKKNLDPSSSMSLVIILRSLWLQRGALLIEQEDKLANIQSTPYKDKTGYCSADLEIFAQEGETYKAFTKIKGEFVYAPYNPRNIADIFSLPFDSLARKLKGMDITTQLLNKKPFTIEQVNANYQQRFDLPVLKTNSSQKGIFLSFEDFKQNKITYTDFVRKESALTDEIYIIQNGHEELLTGYWGFFDGNDYYIRLGFSFFKLTRQNNTWDLYGNKFISRNHYDYSPSTSYGTFNMNSSVTKIDYKPLQVNMETGDVY